jgi:hypothetical protein
VCVYVCVCGVVCVRACVGRGGGQKTRLQESVEDSFN